MIEPADFSNKISCAQIILLFLLHSKQAGVVFKQYSSRVPPSVVLAAKPGSCGTVLTD
jgi:hypothetical protein